MARAVAGFLAVLAIGAVALVVRAATLGDVVVLPLGVVPDASVAPLARGHEACQSPIPLPDGIDAVEFNPGTPSPTHSPGVDVLVRVPGRGTVLSTGHLARGFDRTRPQTVRIGHVAGGRTVAVCFRNDGPEQLDVFGNLEGTGHGVLAATHLNVPGNSTSTAYVDTHPVAGDLVVTLLRARPSSLLSRVPAIVRRASLFRPGFVGPAAWWTLLGCAALLIPLALAYALARSTRDRPAERP